MAALTNYIESNLGTLLMLYLAVVNVLAFMLCGIDKIRAETKRFRIRERTLLLVAFIGGSFLMLAGMLIFRHKTRKPKFTVTVPLFLILHIFLIYCLSQNCLFFSPMF